MHMKCHRVTFKNVYGATCAIPPIEGLSVLEHMRMHDVFSSRSAVFEAPYVFKPQIQYCFIKYNVFM